MNHVHSVETNQPSQFPFFLEYEINEILYRKSLVVFYFVGDFRLLLCQNANNAHIEMILPVVYLQM